MSAGGLLVVDDDGLVSWALQKAALALKVPVHLAATTAEALATVERHAVDLAFLDVRLPDGDGLDILPTMHRLAPDMRIVVITSDATPLNRERALQGGAWQFIEKPFDLSEVTRVIRDCLCTESNRRADPRRACNAPLRLELLDETGPAFDGAALDASEGGLRLQTNYPLRPGQRLKVQPASGPTSGAIRPEATACVVWTRAEGPAITAGLAYL